MFLDVSRIFREKLKPGNIQTNNNNLYRTIHTDRPPLDKHVYAATEGLFQ